MRPDALLFEVGGHDALPVPVIILSRYGRDQNIDRAFDPGAADYVVKPFFPTELIGRIKAALKR